MNKFNADANDTREDIASGAYKGSSSSAYHRQTAASYDDRLAELEIENSRLHRLVAELLIKNQQLRKSD
jgi:hypothetical protein